MLCYAAILIAAVLVRSLCENSIGDEGAAKIAAALPSTKLTELV